jgi:RHS repeat-associated protein
LGRRLFKETQGQRTWFGWDGDAMTLDVIEGQAREFIYRPETFEPLAVLGQTAQGTQLGTLHYVNDPNGCPTRLIDSKGHVLWAASYSAWGAVDKLHASEVSNPIRLQGQYEDGETGLYYNRHRYYDATVGVFVSQDPLGLIAGESLSNISPNINGWIDPLGLSCQIHHIIPKADSHGFKTHPLIKEAGIDIVSDAKNLMKLDGHSGGHTQAYYDAVRKALNDKLMTHGGQGKAKATEGAYQVMDELRSDIASGKLKLYNSKVVTAV